MTRQRHWLVATALMGALTLPLQVFSENPEALRLYNQGIDAYMQGRTTQAQTLFEQAVMRDANYADAFYNLGSIYYQNKKYAQAKEAFRRTVELNPGDFQAKYNLALSLEKLQEYGPAYDLFGQIPATDKKYADARRKMDELKPKLAVKPASMATPATVGQPWSPPAQPAQPAQVTPVVDPNAKLTVKTFAKGFSGPTGMTIGPGGYMYVANYSKNVIYKVGANGEKVVFVEGDGLNGPIGLTYNTKTNELYAANYLKNNVVRINEKGDVSVMASGLNKPYNLFLDTVNNALYISEQETNAVSRIELP